MHICLLASTGATMHIRLRPLQGPIRTNYDGLYRDRYAQLLVASTGATLHILFTASTGASMQNY